jgi:hypothetical protein
MFQFGPSANAATYVFTTPANTLSADPFLTWPPVVARNADSYAGLVQLPDRTDVFFSKPFRQITLPGTASGQTALAGNGSDILLVWTNPHVTGIVVHADGTVSEPFTITEGGFQPRVVTINSNDFAVLYRTDFNQQSASIQGRIVYLQTPKRRGIR